LQVVSLGRPAVILATANSVLQRVPPRDVIKAASFSAAPGNRVNTEELQEYLVKNGFSRTGTVVDPGDYAIRGGIIDIFPPGYEEPVRLDFFGDTLESLRSFDPQTQRTTHQLKQLKLDAASEVLLTPETISRFRTGYAATFSGSGLNDAVYEAVSAGRRYQGMEHWLALFYEQLETILDYAGDCVISMDHLADEAMEARRTQIAEYYDARVEALEQGHVWRAGLQAVAARAHVSDR
jgi:transcription-repair coupling factor (superfamily II helicase)